MRSAADVVVSSKSPPQSVWINPASLTKDARLPSFYAVVGDVFAVGPDLFLATKYGAKKLSRNTGEALIRRQSRQRKQTRILTTAAGTGLVSSLVLAALLVGGAS